MSTDQVNWAIVGAVTGGGGVEETAVGPQAARYLRVYGLTRGTPWGYSLYEIDAYGTAEGVEDPLVGNYGEGAASGELAALTDISAIRAAIQANKNRILKDGNGNMVIARDKWIAYDYDNRPVKVVTEDGTLTTLAYDHEGQRTQQKVYAPGTSTPTVSTYIGTVYEEKGVERIKYIHAGGQRIARVSTTQGTGYFHTDHLGSTGLLTNGAGAVAGSWSYLPFGGTYKKEGTGTTDWRYTGQRQDDGSGLYYYNARYYDPTLGRFITPDTLIADPYNPQNLNRYSYVENNPINFTDPTGNWKFKNFLKSTLDVGAMVGMVAVSIYMPQTALYWGAAIGSAHGAAMTGLNGGNWNQVVQSAVIGGASGMAAGYVGPGVGGSVGASFGGFAGAVVGGAAAGAVGGASAAALTPGSDGGDIWMATYRGAAYGASSGAALYGGRLLGQSINNWADGHGFHMNNTVLSGMAARGDGQGMVDFSATRYGTAPGVYNPSDPFFAKGGVYGYADSSGKVVYSDLILKYPSAGQATGWHEGVHVRQFAAGSPQAGYAMEVDACRSTILRAQRLDLTPQQIQGEIAYHNDNAKSGGVNRWRWW